VPNAQTIHQPEGVIWFWDAIPEISPLKPCRRITMQGWKIGRLFGIDLYVHWTFLLLLALYGFQGYQVGGINAAAYSAGLITAMFGCVVLHELGHSLTARRFGIETREITLSPIGGVAALERIPRRPREEFLITIAGPAVNVVIAGVLYGLLSLVDPRTITSPSMSVAYRFLSELMVINVVLAIFNMLPAFPMDGGRILRATLAVWLEYCTATKIAVRVGQVVAVGIGIAGIMGYFGIMAILIAVFVFMAGEAELKQVC
jgi:Zn-dependent protease